MTSVFTPLEDSQTVSTTGSSQNIALSAAKAARKVMSITFMSGSNAPVFARFGDSSVTVSAANGYVVAPSGQVAGDEKIIGIPHGVTHVAFITGAGSNKDIKITEGDLL